MTLRHATVDTGLGALLLVADDDALCGVYFPDHRHPPKEVGEAAAVAGDPVLSAAATQVREYLDGRRTGFELPLRPRGDDFSQQVWRMLQEIPYGRTTTYGALAARLGNPRLAQRVGQAVGRNPLSIVVPCHRVLGADGSLTGFAGGLDRKRALLALEEPAAAATDRLF